MDAKKLITFFGLLTISLLLAHCGPSQAELDAEATLVAADVTGTQTAEAPTSTPTPISSTPTHTPGPPTATPIPTATYTPQPATATSTVDLEATTAAETAQRAEELLVQGIENIEAEDYEQAVENLSEVIALEPDNAEAYYQRGLAYGHLENWEQALADFDTAIELAADDPRAYSKRALVYLPLGDSAQAIADCNQALKLDPDHAEAYQTLGMVYIGQGDVEQAIQGFDKAIELDPDLAEAYIWRGSAYAEAGNSERAISDFEYYLELVPDAPNRGAIISVVEALKTGDFSTTPLDWLVTTEELNAFTNEIGILQWELQEELPGQSRVCRMFTGVSWSANPNMSMNCVNSVTPGSTSEDIIESLYDQQILYPTDIVLKPFVTDSNFALYAHMADNGHAIYDAFLIGDGVIFRASVGVGIPVGYTPEMLFDEQGEVIEAFLNNILLINLERSGQSAILDN